jgi:hypothetical protein
LRFILLLLLLATALLLLEECQLQLLRARPHLRLRARLCRDESGRRSYASIATTRLAPPVQPTAAAAAFGRDSQHGIACGCVSVSCGGQMCPGARVRCDSGRVRSDARCGTA